jgi:hypothetical protein
MFKKFMNQAAAAFTPASAAESEAVRSLQNMGFSQEQARNALAATGDLTNTQGALELLLSQEQTTRATTTTPSTSGSAATSRPTPSSSPTDDIALQQAMEESLITETQRQQNSTSSLGGAKKESRTNSVSAARAGSAALSRFENSSNAFGSNNKQSAKKKKSGPAVGVKKAPTSNNGSATTTTRSISPKLEAYIPSDVRPDMKIPARLSDKSKEEQITRSVLRLTPYPVAVDTLLKALLALQKDPTNARYRQLDKSNPGFQRAFHNVPGVDDLLAAINFQPTSTSNPQQLTLLSSRVDIALLFLAVGALEQARSKDEYKDAKQKSEFSKLVQDVKEGRRLLHPAVATMDEEMIARAGFMSKCPSEPPEGRGAIMTVLLGEDQTSANSNDSETGTTRILQRRFDGDDTLGDVLNWLGSAVGTYAVYQLCDTREWCLVDKHRHPDNVPIPCSTEGQKRQTLQYLGCWPSGKLQLRPTSDDLWRTEGKVTQQAGSSRGLGAAPSHH